MARSPTAELIAELTVPEPMFLFCPRVAETTQSQRPPADFCDPNSRQMHRSFGGQRLFGLDSH